MVRENRNMPGVLTQRDVPADARDERQQACHRQRLANVFPLGLALADGPAWQRLTLALPSATPPTPSPIAGTIYGALLVVGGVLMFVYRARPGGATGYYAGRGKYVDKPTPGCVLIPFALALIVGGLGIIKLNLFP